MQVVVAGDGEYCEALEKPLDALPVDVVGRAETTELTLRLVEVLVPDIVIAEPRLAPLAPRLPLRTALVVLDHARADGVALADVVAVAMQIATAEARSARPLPRTPGAG